MSEPDSIPALPKPLEMAKLCISRAVNQGDIVIDATLGNGHDALFLAKLVGDQGKVIGFDIQQIAVDSASQRLANSGLNNYEFHCKGHQHIAQEVDESVSAVMFNLGYLPSADKSVISQKETTLIALEAAMDLLKPSGVISIMCYPGHQGGEEEAYAVLEFTSKLERKLWRSVKYGFTNAPNNPAFLILLQKM